MTDGEGSLIDTYGYDEYGQDLYGNALHDVDDWIDDHKKGLLAGAIAIGVGVAIVVGGPVVATIGAKVS